MSRNNDKFWKSIGRMSRSWDHSGWTQYWKCTDGRISCRPLGLLRVLVNKYELMAQQNYYIINRSWTSSHTASQWRHTRSAS